MPDKMGQNNGAQARKIACPNPPQNAPPEFIKVMFFTLPQSARTITKIHYFLCLTSCAVLVMMTQDYDDCIFMNHGFLINLFYDRLRHDHKKNEKF